MTSLRRLLSAASASLFVAVFVVGCVSSPPRQSEDLCELFDDRPRWFKAAARVEKRWRVPIEIQMAFVQRESSFNARARPPRRRLLGFIPWRRPSSAYGYAQATNATWQDYRSATGRRFADRNNFSDALDFVGWYNNESHDRLGLRFDDAYRLYLAYHEGRGGYARGSYKRRPKVVAYARTVADRAQRYGNQLAKCRKRFERRRRFLFF